MHNAIFGIKAPEIHTDFSPDDTAIDIVTQYVINHLDKTDQMASTIEFSVYTVWKAKVLQNWKYLISTSLFDGMYYEVTYNGDHKEWYLDVYKKFDNKVIADGEDF